MLEQLSAENDAEAGPSRVFSSSIGMYFLTMLTKSLILRMYHTIIIFLDNTSQTGRVSSLFKSHVPDSEHTGREDPASSLIDMTKEGVSKI